MIYGIIFNIFFGWGKNLVKVYCTSPVISKGRLQFNSENNKTVSIFYIHLKIQVNVRKKYIEKM